MELKKNPKYDTKRYGLNFFLAGLLVAELLALYSFTYTKYDRIVKEEIIYSADDDFEEIADITIQEPPPPAEPPPPPPPATVTVVEDDVLVDTTVKLVLNDPKDYIPKAAPPPPKKKPDDTGEQEPFEAVENEPTYPGGEDDRKRFIIKHLVYPPLDIENQKQGKVYVKFVVNTDGSLSRVHAVKSFSDDAAAEAVRVTKMMKWNPGSQRGKKVPVWVVMPVVFKLY